MEVQFQKNSGEKRPKSSIEDAKYYKDHGETKLKSLIDLENQ